MIWVYRHKVYYFDTDHALQLNIRSSIAMATSTSVSAFQQLKHAQSIDSTWKASIFVIKNRNIGNSDTANTDTAVTNSSNVQPISHSDLQSIDIVPYLKEPSIEEECFYLHQLKYPSGSSFYDPSGASSSSSSSCHSSSSSSSSSSFSSSSSSSFLHFLHSNILF